MLQVAIVLHGENREWRKTTSITDKVRQQRGPLPFPSDLKRHHFARVEIVIMEASKHTLPGLQCLGVRAFLSLTASGAVRRHQVKLVGKLDTATEQALFVGRHGGATSWYWLC